MGARACATACNWHISWTNRKARTKDATEAEQYLYDSIYRLLNVVSTKPEAFAYDPVGNRQSGPGIKDTGYQHDSANRMTIGRKLTYGYDNAGNQTTKTVPNAADKSWVQTWDYNNRLTKVEKIKGTERRTVSFKYDPFGRRIEKRFEQTRDGVTVTETTTYVYDNEDIVLEIFTTDTTTEKTFYTHGPGIDEPLALERNGSSYFYHADGLNSITAITDANKAVVQSYEYDSYGMQKPSTGFRNSYAYTGREWDKETGLYYYRARYYDPMEGGFISKDPIGFAGGDVNLWNYVSGNSLNNVYPSGLFDISKFHGFDDFQYYKKYGGPNWTSGQRNSYENLVKKRMPLLNPSDSEDRGYMNHDKNYGYCRTEVYKDKQWLGFNDADSNLISHLMTLPLDPRKWEEPPSSPVSANIHRFMAIPIFLTQITVRSLVNSIPEIWRNINAK